MFELLTILLLLSMLIVLYRFLIGPTITDRIIAFDVMNIMGVGLLIILSLIYQRSLYLDIALVFGLIGFLGSTIFGRYIEQGV